MKGTAVTNHRLITKLKWLALVLLLLIPSVSFGYSTQYSTTTVRQYVIEQSFIDNVDPGLALYVIEHESYFCRDKYGDMDLYFHGKQVRARGCWQITQYFHPEISDTEAFSLQWSTAWAMYVLRNKTRCLSQFSTCRDYYNSVATKASSTIFDSLAAK